MIFLFPLKFYHPHSEFFYICIFAWEKSKYFMTSQYVPAVPDPGKRHSTGAHIIVTQQWSFVSMDQMSHSSWFLIGGLFYDIKAKRQWKRHDIPKQAFFPPLIPTPAPTLVSEEPVLLTCVQAENGTVFSVVIASVGFTMQAFPTRFPLGFMEILGAEGL